MKILIVSDAWHPQTNGVVRTLEATIQVLRTLGHTVEVIGPATLSFFSIPLPTYPDIRLVLAGGKQIAAVMDGLNPDAVHIATEGPLGWSARALCLRRGVAFTTAYHTRFPEYLAARLPGLLGRLVLRGAYLVLRHFHAPARAVLVPTPSMAAALTQHGFQHVALWSRGVDTTLFRPGAGDAAVYDGMARPILLYVGRVSVEKNLPAFLALETPGTKVVVGAGPERDKLQTQFPATRFLGERAGQDLAVLFAQADLFVFPSRSDTFGLVLLEAAASGLRLAAFPVPGPRDVFADPATRAFAVMDEDLGQAVQQALALPVDSAAPRAFALARSWEAATAAFLTYLTQKK